MNLSDYIIPVLIAFILIFGIIKRVDVFSAFVEGAEEGLRTAAGLIPVLVCLLVCIAMFKASGAVDALTRLLAPITGFFGFPEECTPLILLRPVSGSGALAIFEGILFDVGPDSFAGRVASVMMGSTETTFYTVAVYFSAVGVKNTRYAIPAALLGDMTGWIASAATVLLLFG